MLKYIQHLMNTFMYVVNIHLMKKNKLSIHGYVQ